MQKVTIAAQNGVVELIGLPADRAVAIALHTFSTNHAAADFVLEVSGNGKDSWATPVKMIDPTTKTDVASLTGVNKAGWADIPAFTSARLRRTDANAGNSSVGVNFAP